MTRMQQIKCEKIAEHYGLDSQESQSISELSELLHVLTRRNSQRGIDWKNDLIDEMADVNVMIQQLCTLHGISHDELNERINFKLNRQLERIKNGE